MAPEIYDVLDAGVKFRDFGIQRGNIIWGAGGGSMAVYFFFHMLFSYLGNEEQPNEGRDIIRRKFLVIIIYQG